VRTCILVLLLTAPGFAQRALTVDKLIQFITSSIRQNLPDKEVAVEIASITLSQKLDDRTIEDLQREGAGPRTVAALTRLADQSAKLAPPAAVAPMPGAAPAGPPPPSRAEQDRVLREVQEYAQGYVKSLPDFLCLEVTRRSIDMHAQPGGPYSWSPADRLAEKLSFVDHHENYELISQNENAMFGKTWESVGGALSRGDWASILSFIFDPHTQTEFRWKRWGNLDQKLYHVYEYRVDKEHSTLTIDHDHQQKITPAYHGEIFVPASGNREGRAIFRRVTVEPEMPSDFPIQDIHEILKYDYADISGQKFLLPIASDVTMRSGRIASRNEIAFRKYQKYSADTSITFDAADDDPKGETPPNSETPRKK
jgi:hypothetical protein